jgi:hypothetical protein
LLYPLLSAVSSSIIAGEGAVTYSTKGVFDHQRHILYYYIKYKPTLNIRSTPKN